MKRKRERLKIDINSIITSMDNEVLTIAKLNSLKKLTKNDGEFDNIIKDSYVHSDKRKNFNKTSPINNIIFNNSLIVNNNSSQPFLSSLLVQNVEFLNLIGKNELIKTSENENENTTKIELEKYCYCKDRNTMLSKEIIIKSDKILDFLFSNKKKFNVSIT